MHPARAYAWFTFLTGLGMACTVASYVPYLQNLGLSLAEVALLNAFFWAMIVVAELPTGMVADGKSRRWSIRAGILVQLIGMFSYALAHGFISALASELTIGIGMAFLSGAQQAWLVDALAKRGEQHRIGHAFGAAAATSALGMIVGGAAGAWIGTMSYRLPWIAAGTIFSATLAFVFRELRNEGEPEHRVTELAAFRLAFRAVRNSGALIWSVFAAACFGLVLPFNHYWTLFFKERVGQAGLAGVWVPMYLALAVSGAALRFRGIRDGYEAAGLVAAISLTGFGLVFIGWPSGVVPAMGFVLIHEIGRGLFDPLLDAFTARRVESAYRATFGSLQSLLGKIGYAIVLVGVWFATRGLPTTSATIIRVWEVAGSLLVFAALSLWFFRPRQYHRR